MTQITPRMERLTDLVEIKHGFAFSSEFFGPNGDYILLTPGNFSEAGGFRDLGSAQKRFSGPAPLNFILKKGDVLIAMTEQSPGLLGATIKVPKSDAYLHNQRLGLLSVKNPEKICLNYLYHAFNAPHVRKEISISAAGTKVKHTSPTKLSAVEVFLPALADQERTARLLDEWDTAIQKTELLIAAKERRFKVLRERLVASPRKSVGDRTVRGREMMKFGEIFALSKEVAKAGTTLEVLSVTTGGIVRQSEYFNKHVASEDRSGYLIVQRGQLVMSGLNFWMGSIDFQTICDVGIVSPAYKVFSIVGAGFDIDYLRHYVRTGEMRKILAMSSVQGASIVRRNLDMDQLLDSRIGIPTAEKQRAIAAALNAMEQELGLLEEQCAALKSQKRGLMQKLLTGQWRIKVRR